jgi:hypothetical protein
MKVLYDTMPALVQREGSLLRIFHSFQSVSITGVDNETVEKFEGYNIDIEGPADYGNIVSAIIRGEYPDQKKDAVILNRELVRDNPAHEKAEEYNAEYELLQAWRATAKQVATEVIAAL